MEIWICTFLLVLGSVCALKHLPPYTKVCARSNPNFNACALQSAKYAFPFIITGDREYDIPSFDPLAISEMNVIGGSGRAGLVLNMKDILTYGLNNSDIQEVNFGFGERYYMEIVVTAPVVSIIGNYEVSGKILLLPVVGKGNINITLVNSTIRFVADYELTDKEDKSYIHPTGSKTTVKPSKVHIHLTNLFNGNKLLGNQMNVFLNENWRELYKDLAPLIADAFSEVLVSIIIKFVKETPFEEIFPDSLPE